MTTVLDENERFHGFKRSLLSPHSTLKAILMVSEAFTLKAYREFQTFSSGVSVVLVSTLCENAAKNVCVFKLQNTRFCVEWKGLTCQRHCLMWQAFFRKVPEYAPEIVLKFSCGAKDTFKAQKNSYIKRTGMPVRNFEKNP